MNIVFMTLIGGKYTEEKDNYREYTYERCLSFGQEEELIKE